MPFLGINILGIEVPSTNPVFLAFLAVHVVAGATCALTGAAAALTRKGSSRHTRTGTVYFWGLGVVFVTATALAVMRWAEDYHLFIIGSVAFAAGTVGYLHRRLHRPGDAGHIVGMGLSYIALLTAFYVDNGKNLPVWKDLPHLTYWLLPGVVGVPLILRALRRTRRRQPGLRATARAPVPHRADPEATR
jgi:hypothetical protein